MDTKSSSTRDIEKRKLRWHERVKRMAKERWTMKILECTQPGKRRRRRFVTDDGDRNDKNNWPVDGKFRVIIIII